MMDPGHQLTEEAIAALESKITSVYSKAAEDLQRMADEYFAGFESRDAEVRAQVESGEVTEEYYQQWRLNNIGRGRRFEAMRDNMAARAQNASEVAMQYTSDALPNAYALNRNYQAYEIESQVAKSGGIYAGVDFTLFNEATVKRLITEDPELMPEYSSANVKYDPAVDYAWGQSKIREAVTSGILRGVSTKKLGVELQQTITGMSRASAMRAARTAMTSAQNAGRLDTINYGAEHYGIDSVKIWISQSDGRVRDSHVQLNGVIVARKEKFPNGLMYPGDRSGAPAEVYNCRCSLGSVLPEMLEDYTGDGIFSTGHTVESYNEWLEEKEKAAYGAGSDAVSDDSSITEEERIAYGRKVLPQTGKDDKVVIRATGANRTDDMTIKSSVTGTNPHYNEEERYCDNCQRCVQAREARMRGLLVEAMPSVCGTDPIRVGNECFVDSAGKKPLFTYNLTSNDIESRIYSSPNNSRFFIYMQTDDISHVFCADYVDGHIIYSDPQTGVMNVGHYLQEGDYDQFGILRVDNKKFVQNAAIISATMKGV